MMTPGTEIVPGLIVAPAVYWLKSMFEVEPAVMVRFPETMVELLPPVETS